MEIDDPRFCEQDNMREGFNVRDCIKEGEMSNAEVERVEFWISANRAVRESGKHNLHGCKIKVNDNWDLDKFERWLIEFDCTDLQLIEYLKYGWPLNADGMAEQEVIPPNQAGARTNTKALEEYIKSELQRGSIIGPFYKNAFGKEARVSPLDTRPKKDSEELRVILNLSYPFEGPSVNANISKEYYASGEEINLTYPSTDDLARLVKMKGKGSKIFIRDLRKAYRQLWMCPGSILWLGFMFNDRFYFDMTLSMGSRSAAYCCQHTTNGISHIYKGLGYEDVNYLDDLGAAEFAEITEEMFDCLGYILGSIRITESVSKAVAPSCCAVFLRVLYNTVNLTMSIKKDRINEIMDILNAWANKTSGTLHELQMLLGKLNFVCSTVRAGRIFISRLINELKKFPKNGKKRLSAEFHKDIDWWIMYMQIFDGVSIIPEVNWEAPDSKFATDTCLTSLGGWSHGSYFRGDFPDWILSNSSVHINELEIMAIIVGLKIWGEKCRNRNCLIYCDNKVTVDVINSGSAKNHFTQACLREICYLTAKLNAMIKVVHLEGISNRIPDSLSRWNLGKKYQDRFLQLTAGQETNRVYLNQRMFEFSNSW